MASAGTAPARVSDQPQPALQSPSVVSDANVHWPGLFLLDCGADSAEFDGRDFGKILALCYWAGDYSGNRSKAKELGAAGAVLDLLISGTIAGIFVVLGNFAGKRIRWAFLAGMALYGFDGLVCLGASDILGAALHAYTIFAISRGLAKPQTPVTA